jgi:hypothetical protein
MNSATALRISPCFGNFWAGAMSPVKSLLVADAVFFIFQRVTEPEIISLNTDCGRI